MTPPVNIDRRSAVSLRGLGGARANPTGAATAAMTQMAGRVGATLTSELGLAEVDPRDRYTGGTANDAYGVEGMATELSEALGGGPKACGDLARALHEFVRESATLVAARRARSQSPSGSSSFL